MGRASACVMQRLTNRTCHRCGSWPSPCLRLSRRRSPAAAAWPHVTSRGVRLLAVSDILEMLSLSLDALSSTRWAVAQQERTKCKNTGAEGRAPDNVQGGHECSA